MYKLAVVPKVSRFVEYSSAYGSQHDNAHIKRCLKLACFNIDISYKVIYESSFLKNYKNFDGVLFLGLTNKSLEFLSSAAKLDKFTWSFNQCEWVTRNEIFNNVSIVFEQSTRDVTKYISSTTDVHFLPLGFQSDRFEPKYYKPDFDIVFNGTLYRNRREDSKFHRRDLIEMLLQHDISVVNYNGRSRKKDEKNLLSKLACYKNFKVINRFGDSKHYLHGMFSLDLPFLDTETGKHNEKKYGMNWNELENTIWLNHWDSFRCIGSKCNMITFDSPEIRELGLSDDNVNFYQSTPDRLESMAEEIIEIISRRKIKMIDHNTWHANTYNSRWDFIINKIRNKKSLSYRNINYSIVS